MSLERHLSIIPSTMSVVSRRPVASRASRRSNFGCLWSSLVPGQDQSELAGKKVELEDARMLKHSFLCQL